jgi:hypothetical protein
MMNDEDAELNRKMRTLAFIGLGLVFVAVLAMAAAQTSGMWAALGICLIVLLSSAAVGAAFGFLFALPRLLTKEAPGSDSPGKAGQPAETAIQPAGKRFLGTNNNLEKVSDWLTTIIVGVGLTQLASINDLLLRFRLFINDTAKVFPGGEKCSTACSAGFLPSVAPLILIFGLIIGFLFLYLYTRLIIVGMLNSVEGHLQEPMPTTAAHTFNSLVNTLPGATENVKFAVSASGGAPSVGQGLEMMGSLLYKPGRHQDVINLAGQLSNTYASNRPEYWLYLAAAFGQKHHALGQEPGATEENLQSARDNAFDAARRAIQIDPSMRERLWAISDPDGEDDDLADFRSDPEFLKITGKYRKSSSL